MSSFVLKIIAMITMIIDHMGYVIYGTISAFNYVGRIAFPIFAFQISEGYVHTKNIKKYLIRLLLFAFISQVPYVLFCNMFMENIYDIDLNIFFTLFLGLSSIILFNEYKNKILKYLSVAIIVIIAEFIHVDYGAWGVLLIFIFYLLKDKKVYMTISYIILCVIKYLPNLIKYNFQPIFITYFVFTLLPIGFILLYNKKQGIKIKYFLYLFYPIHLVLLFLLNIYLN